MTDEKQVRQIVREELDEQGRMTRRGVLGLLGGGAVAGALTGSASGAAQTDGNLSLADVTADTYRISGNRYGGPASARSQLESELGNSDAGSKYLGEDNGALYHWTGSNWELMQSTSAAVNTEKLNNATVFVTDDILARDINEVIDAVSTDVDGVGGAVLLDQDVTVTVEQEVVTVKSDVFFGGVHPSAKATVKLADGLDDDAPANQLVRNANTTEIAVSSAHIHNLYVDGNAANNPNASKLTRGGIALTQTWDNGDGTFDHGPRPTNSTVKNVTVENTLASNLYIDGERCHAARAQLKNSTLDHHVYNPAPIDCTMRAITCKGYGVNASFAFGNSGGRDYYGNTFEDIRWRNLDPTGSDDDNLDKLIRVRPATGGGRVAGNTFRTLRATPSSTADSAKIRLEEPTEIDGLTWEGTQAADDSIVDLRATADCQLSDINITVTGGSGDIVALAITNCDDIEVSSLTVTEDAADVTLDALDCDDGASGELNNISVTGLRSDVSGTDIQIVGNAGGARQIAIPDFTAVGGLSKFIDASTAVTFADGTMLDQDITDINNPYDGYKALHNGDSSQAAGPYIYHNTQWRGYADASGNSFAP